MANQKSAAVARPDPDPPGVSLSAALLRLAEELAHSARLGTELQWALSGLLENSEACDTTEEMHMLQNLDRLHQVSSDLARYVQTLARFAPCDPEIDLARLLADVRLASVRHRLFPGADDETPPEIGEITWF